VPLPHPATAGSPDPANASAVVQALDRAVAAVRQGDCAALVTGPLSKAVIARGTGRSFSGHTEYLAELAGGVRPVMMLAGAGLRVALVTTHLPLRTVPDAVTHEAVTATLRTTVTALRRDFAVDRPRVLVTGLNPHAGEDGTLGTEEQAVIEPALEALRRELADQAELEGPLPADTAFLPDCTEGADAVVAMYHDQGLAPLKQHAFGRAVNITLGLPFVRTSVDHGTAFDLAGTGRAESGSFREALTTARELAANRASSGS
jgi:4-hydroxythreonine-4-phosphate dehydrogenase